MKLLLVEDDEMIAEAVSTALGDAGYDVQVARDGDSANSALREHAYEMVLLDITLLRVSGCLWPCGHPPIQEHASRTKTRAGGTLAQTTWLSRSLRPDGSWCSLLRRS